jgi:hypothetical protein
LTNEQTENGEHYVGVETLATSNDLEVAKGLAEKISKYIWIVIVYVPLERNHKT